MFVAVGYRKLNQLREQYCAEARAKGYRLLSYLCSKATHWGDTRLGDNVFVFEDNTLQPFVQIGNGTILLEGLGVPNGLHRMQASVDLSSGSFFDLATATADADGLLQYEDAAAGLTKRFYRLASP